MLRKKFMTFGVTLALTVFLLVGCGDGNQKNTIEDITKMVQVTKVDGATITADVGELSSVKKDMPEGTPPSGMPSEELEGKNPAGGAPPEKKEDRDSSGSDKNVPPEDLKENGDIKKQNGEPPSGKPGGSRFTTNGESITFTISDSTQIMQEFQQGSEEASAEDIVENSVLEITFDGENQPVKVVIKNLQAGRGFGGSDEVTNGTSANTITEEKTVNGESYTSDGDDENALRVDGTGAVLKNITVKKTKGNSSNTENGDFYGQNAGLLVLNGSTATIEGGTFQTSAVNGNAVFSYGEGTTVNISDATIRTTQNNSGGIQTTGGATMNAANLDVQTEGNSSAAIRSDRGGGTVKVTKGKYVTNGTGSPAIYCTADISVEEATLLANASEGVVVEGKNSVSLKNCDITGNMNNTYNGDSDENIHCIMIYQSMSGDAAVGEADFDAEGGSITSKAGDLFYITNTDCTISLKDVKLTLANDIFLRVEGNSSSRGWGTEGSNGGDVTLTADSQKIEGNILVDDISSLKLSMSNGTNYKGSINPDGTSGEVEVTLDNGSTWTLTGDSYITGFHGDTSNIDTNGYHLYVKDEQIK
ncbi:MAG: hypothetical protein HFJ09_15175 [Lachnospiraceae bacterium]|nr:hypothetical protein [Lachnospiraceae bacterium]